jgi:hypothetical protein
MAKYYSHIKGQGPEASKKQKRLIYQYYKMGKTDKEGFEIVRKVFVSFTAYRLKQIIKEMKTSGI